MKLSFDPEKNERNILERRLSFEEVQKIDFDNAKSWQDTKKIYPEVRFIAIGYLNNRAHVLCFSIIKNHVISVISFRKANTIKGEKHNYPLTRD